MFRDWFGSRAPRSSERRYSFRPQLEYLEGRLAPSGISPMDPHGPPGPPGGPPGPPGGPPGHGPGGPPGHINNNGNVHINAHDSFNTTITDSFNTSVNNITVNQYINVAATPQPQVQQAFSASVGQAVPLGIPALISLVEDEVQLAADTYLSFTASGMGNAALTQEMHNLQLGIQTNSLEGTSIGETVGYLAFDLTLDALVSANASV